MQKYLFGNLSNGQSVYAYKITDDDTEVVIIDYGATVQTFSYKGKDLILSFDDAISYQRFGGYLGACVGRVANRIANSKFSLDGKEYLLDRNDGNNTLHGGCSGFSSKVWTVESFSQTEVVLSILSSDGEGGFPANVKATVRYYLCENGLGIEYLVTTDGKTPISMTNHAYFNVNQSGNLQNTWLTVNADHFTPVDETLIPTGELRPVKGTPFDFTSPKQVLQDIDQDYDQLKIAKGYDHNFALNGKGFRKVATLEGESLKIDCYTDREGIQIYSGNFLSGTKGKGGAIYNFRGAICLETQSFPNAVNQKDFPSCIITPENPYRSKTEYHVEEK